MGRSDASPRLQTRSPKTLWSELPIESDSSLLDCLKTKPGGPFEPYSGDYYVYSQMADQAYKRLGGIFTLPADTPSLKFWISYDIEADWDYVFVEIQEVGSGDWTTLPDVSSSGSLTTSNTGDSCVSGWVDQIHPFLANYMDDSCNPSSRSNPE